ncbi:MAG: hypothetical protein GWP14_10800 [Actinobacteria bacterium]|nr:hypothetical protein [Actinomycetota bacterium]
MPVSDALAYWQSLESMAGPQAKVHLTGGEPFSNWPALLAILQAAHAEGLVAHELETNASWCTSPQLVRQRCRQFKQLDLGRLVVSCDIYHQQFVPFQRVRLLVQVAQDVLGSERVRIRWRDFFADPVDINGLGQADCQRFFRRAWQVHRDRLTGRAARMIAPLLELHPPEVFAEADCYKPIFASRHVHIDPSGNVFPGVCAGLVLGNARRKPLPEIWSDFACTEDEILLTLARSGPYGLLQIANGLGFGPSEERFADKCHLCWEVRSFLAQTGKFEPTIGPARCYRAD